MYVPPHFSETDPAVLHGLIERYSFGLLISQADDEPFASHLPFLLDRTAGPHATLFGHMARENPQWRGLAGKTALAVFSGPHAYISPTWYGAVNTVPTWNYVAVHAYGTVELVDDREALLQLLERTVGLYESGIPKPWSMDDSRDYADRQLAHIIGFRIRIAKLEGKWKLNQNHPAERRAKVAAALREQGAENAVAVAELMAPRPRS